MTMPLTFVDVSRRVRRAPILGSQRWMWRSMGVPYRAVLRALSRARGITRDVAGDTYRWRYPFSEFDRDFERPVLEAFSDLIEPNAIVLDIGASFGLYSLVAGRRVGPNGKVFAFEPSRAADVLADHIKLNGLEDRIEIIPVVISDTVGSIEFWEAGNTRLASLSRAAAARGEKPGQGAIRRVCQSTTVDAFCEERGITPDLLKVDVEGAEALVLRGAERFLRMGQGHVVLEVHPGALSAFGVTDELVLASLDAHGWRGRRIYLRGDVGDPDATVHYIFEARE
jgi:FkbM family methyltransferase